MKNRSSITTFIKSANVEELRSLRAAIDGEIAARSEGPREKKVTTYTDGASRGNPGHAGIGLLIFDHNDEKILQDCRYIGVCTNNEAEYRALLLALERVGEVSRGHIDCCMDSELLVRQLNGQYAVKSEKMARFYDEVKNRMKNFSSVTFRHLPRSHPKMQLADKMANRGIDEAKPFG